MSAKAVTVTIPVYVNTKALMEGDFFSIYRPTAEKPLSKEKLADNKRTFERSFEAHAKRSRTKPGLPGRS